MGSGHLLPGGAQGPNRVPQSLIKTVAYLSAGRAGPSTPALMHPRVVFPVESVGLGALGNWLPKSACNEAAALAGPTAKTAKIAADTTIEWTVLISKRIPASTLAEVSEPPSLVTVLRHVIVAAR